MARIKNCSASVQLSEGIPDRSSSYADHGTKLHEATYCRLVNQQFDFASLSQEDRDAVEFCFDAVKEVRWHYRQAKYEYRMISRIIPDHGGTVDVLLIDQIRSFGELFDFKFGAGVEVFAHENQQLLSYAALAHEEWPDINTWRVHVVQPLRKYNQHTHWDFDSSWIHHHRAELQRAIANPVFRAGSWCQFCPAKAICPELRRQSEWLAALEFRDFTGDPINPAELAERLNAIDAVQQGITAIKQHAQERLQLGEEIPGWKIVKAQGNRAWTDETEAAALAESLGLDVYEKKLVSPAKMEKLVGKKDERRAMLADLVEMYSDRADNGYRLAKDSDRRKAKGVAMDDFSDLIGAQS